MSLFPPPFFFRFVHSLEAFTLSSSGLSADNRNFIAIAWFRRKEKMEEKKMKRKIQFFHLTLPIKSNASVLRNCRLSDAIRISFIFTRTHPDADDESSDKDVI